MEKWDLKSKPLWLSTITQNRNYQDSTYETDHVLGSVDPILNEGELARRVIRSVHITDFKESEHNIYGNNRNWKQEQNSHCDEEPQQKNQGTDSDDMKHCKEHNGTFLSNTHGSSNHNKMGNNSNHIRNSNTRDMVKMALAIVQGRHSIVSTENLSRIWNIGLETAQQTLRVTTQHGVRSAIHPLNCRYRVDQLHFHCHQLNSTFYADGVGSMRLSFIVASSFSESWKRMAGEELSLLTANLNV